ncbi:MAG TPA: hypothetical protein VF974_06415 [Patescibacteria group bacterium]
MRYSSLDSFASYSRERSGLSGRGQIPDSNSGQSIIETLAAIFILVTTLTVGLGLAVSALSSSQQSLNEIVAINLARQGIEVVRMARDSNWLGHDAKADTRSNYPGRLQNCAGTNTLCYPTTYQAVSGDPSFANSFDLTTPSSSPCSESSTNCTINGRISLLLLAGQNVWPTADMYDIGMDSSIYNLFLTSNGHYYRNSGFYPVNFARKLTLTRIDTPPFLSTDSNWKLKVKVFVVWKDRRCPEVDGIDPETLNTPCKVVLEEQLTNWKDYQ